MNRAHALVFVMLAAAPTFTTDVTGGGHHCGAVRHVDVEREIHLPTALADAPIVSVVCSPGLASGAWSGIGPFLVGGSR